MKKYCIGLTLVIILFLTYTAAADTSFISYLQGMFPTRVWSLPEAHKQQTADQAAPVIAPQAAVIPKITDAPETPVPESAPINTTTPSPKTNRSDTGHIGATDRPPNTAAPVNSAQPSAQTPVAIQTMAPSSGAAQEMLGYINAAREKNRLTPLILSNSLCQGAYLKSKDMAVNSYFSHDSPTYGDPFAMMKAQGISYRTAAENIAKNFSVLGSHDAFMNSSGHRANILNPSFHKLGLGFYQKDNYLYVTQWFTD